MKKNTFLSQKLSALYLQRREFCGHREPFLLQQLLGLFVGDSISTEAGFVGLQEGGEICWILITPVNGLV